MRLTSLKINWKMINYLIHTTSIWAVLFIAYKILLSKEKYFTLNRFYLIASLALGLLLPLIQFLDFSTYQIMPEVSALYHEQVNYISHLSTAVNAEDNENASINWTSILFVLISIGMAMMLIRNLIAGFKIRTLYSKSEKRHHPEFTEVRTQKEHLPFSFFRYIFFSAFQLNDEDQLSILKHEIHHVRAKHTWDILFVEAIKIFFWWNPMVHLYKRAITENHEYAADHAAVTQVTRKEYCTLLLQSNMPGVNLDLGHPFFSTYIKKRIDMMYRRNSTKKSYFKFILPAIAIVFMAFIIKEDHLELEYALDSDYIDLFAGDELLEPEVDYTLDREREKIIIYNTNYTTKEGIKYCMYIIDEPRKPSEFEDIEKPEINNYVEVSIDKVGDKSVRHLKMSNDEIFDFIEGMKKKCKEDVNVKLTIDKGVENRIVAEFLEEALERNIKVELNYQNQNSRYDIPSISPLAPKDIIKKNGYGMRIHPVHQVNTFHKGVDLIAKIGTPVFATADGIVSSVKHARSGYGKHIVIDHGNGYKTLYAHLNSFIISTDAEVKQGQQIGLVGSTGMATSPHLHYEVRLDNKALDPTNYGALPYQEVKFHREIGNQEDALTITKKDKDKKIIEGARTLFGLEDHIKIQEEEGDSESTTDILMNENTSIDKNELKDSIIKLGYNVNRGVIVKAEEMILIEGKDYLIDYQLGRLKIINENYLNEGQPINVRFSSNGVDKIYTNDNEIFDVASKVKSDMTYDGTCVPNKLGEYFMADKMSTLETCNTGNVEDDLSCTRNGISAYMNDNKLYPEALIRKGFQGMLMFKITINEKGNIESYKELLREKRGDNYPELVAEGKRLLELVKANKKLSPAECNGKKVKSLIHVSINFKLNEEQLKRVEPKNASNTVNPNQRAVINYISDQGNLTYYYESEMNVPYSIKITDPSGEVILQQDHKYIYKAYRDAFFVPNKINGEYTIEVTQDKQTIKNTMKCEVF